MSEINSAQSTLEKAAHDNFSVGAKAGIGSYARSMYENKKHSFINGAIWQREQDKVLIEELKNALIQIAAWPGNLPDNQYTTRTGPNDAALRGSMLIAMRSIANEALKKFDV